ncbi:MAG: ATP synthase subunit I [bacterium]|nr:hypothetical protein [bacterium]MBU1917882.1 hypothetical protein [bacterium]
MTQTINTHDKTEPALNILIFSILGIGLSCLMLSLVFYPSWTVALGILLGTILSTANFIFLIKIVAKLLNQNYTRLGFTILLIMFKLSFVIGVLLLAFRVLHVNTIAFGIGYLSFIPAVFLYQYLNKNTVNGQRTTNNDASKR